MLPWSLKIYRARVENWTDTTSIKSSKLNIDAVQKTSKDLSSDKSLSPDKSLSRDKVSNVSDIPETLMRE